jgi:hypothetical protein
LCNILLDNKKIIRIIKIKSKSNIGNINADQWAKYGRWYARFMDKKFNTITNN